MISLQQYLEMIGPRIEAAEASGNRSEAIRLLRLLRDVAAEQADKLERLEERKP